MTGNAEDQKFLSNLATANPSSNSGFLLRGEVQDRAVLARRMFRGIIPKKIIAIFEQNTDKQKRLNDGGLRKSENICSSIVCQYIVWQEHNHKFYARKYITRNGGFNSVKLTGGWRRLRVSDIDVLRVVRIPITVCGIAYKLTFVVLKDIPFELVIIRSISTIVWGFLS